MNNIINGKSRWVWLVVVLQIVFLLGWAGYHEGIRQHASTIRLRTLPVDPRDILRGDYMILNYEISRHALPLSWDGPGSEVVVMLKPDGEHHVIDELRTEPPGPDDPRIWVWAAALPLWRSEEKPVIATLRYGIEQYFVPEGKGTPRFDRMEVEVMVSKEHRLYIKQLWLDGVAYP